MYPMTSQPKTENILRTQLILRNGLYLNRQNNKPFTGMAIELDRNENNPFDLSKAITRIEYKNGKRDGCYNYFHKNGQLMFRGNYTNGKLQGLCEGFYENGQLERRENYKNGKLQGSFEAFYHHGQLIETGNFKDGKRHGPWGWFDEDGNQVSGQIFKNGNCVETEFYGVYSCTPIESTGGFQKLLKLWLDKP